MYLILNLCLSYTQLYSYNFGNVILPYIYISKYLYLDICNHMSLYSKGKGFPHGGLGALLLTPRRCCSGGWCDLHINPNIIPYVYIYIYIYMSHGWTQFCDGKLSKTTISDGWPPQFEADVKPHWIFYLAQTQQFYWTKPAELSKSHKNPYEISIFLGKTNINPIKCHKIP